MTTDNTDREELEPSLQDIAAQAAQFLETLNLRCECAGNNYRAALQIAYALRESIKPSRAAVAAEKTTYNQAIEDAFAAIRAESQGGGYWAATYINAIARKCSPRVYVNSLESCSLGHSTCKCKHGCDAHLDGYGCQQCDCPEYTPSSPTHPSPMPEQPKAHYESAHEARYLLAHPVHPDIVVLWFLALKSHWFEDPNNMFFGMREQAKAYLYKWVETGELADDNTTLEIATAMKFREWLQSSWAAATPSTATAANDLGALYGVGGELYTFIHSLRGDLRGDERWAMARRAQELLDKIVAHDAEVEAIARRVTEEAKAEVAATSGAREAAAKEIDEWTRRVYPFGCGMTEEARLSKLTAIISKHFPSAVPVEQSDDAEARRLLTECCYTINALADQQVMPDDFYKRTLEAVGRFMERG